MTTGEFIINITSNKACAYNKPTCSIDEALLKNCCLCTFAWKLLIAK